MKVVFKERASIAAQDMNDGEIGIIVQWGTEFMYNKCIIQRCGQSLIQLGKHKGAAFSGILNTRTRYEDCRVILLEEGDTITI